MFSLLVKWPEKAVSGSSRELAQLSFLVQVERAACVTFPLCAVKVTHGSGAVFLKSQAGADSDQQAGAVKDVSCENSGLRRDVLRPGVCKGLHR
ncbi:hypothetical protein E2B89_17110 [Salmonella enterica]|nr:hypothetical protein [Salmonella enterica]EBH8951167.1 hypothetical protein [Salmonella enterica subsp. diarizonae serovar 48:i:z]EBV2372961.1 hypothetical protein [Salmonella enterica subsp. enterica serovar Enteritidis]ECC9192141.1 hypothetical protein [Salmonella enterica subsp. diarizonae]EAP9281455.1 hypothetical protein [Salmonella enterica]